MEIFPQKVTKWRMGCGNLVQIISKSRAKAQRREELFGRGLPSGLEVAPVGRNWKWQIALRNAQSVNPIHLAPADPENWLFREMVYTGLYYLWEEEPANGIHSKGISKRAVASGSVAEGISLQRQGGENQKRGWKGNPWASWKRPLAGGFLGLFHFRSGFQNTWTAAFKRIRFRLTEYQMYLLGTNISYWMQGDPTVIARIKEHAPSDLCLSAITRAEIWYGIEKSSMKKKESGRKSRKSPRYCAFILLTRPQPGVMRSYVRSLKGRG